MGTLSKKELWEALREPLEQSCDNCKHYEINLLNKGTIPHNIMICSPSHPALMNVNKLCKDWKFDRE